MNVFSIKKTSQNRSKIVPQKRSVLISVLGRCLSKFGPHQSSKVSVSHQRRAHFHVFTRSPFFGRQGPQSHKIEVKMDLQNRPKNHKICDFSRLCH